LSGEEKLSFEGLDDYGCVLRFSDAGRVLRLHFWRISSIFLTARLSCLVIRRNRRLCVFQAGWGEGVVVARVVALILLVGVVAGCGGSKPPSLRIAVPRRPTAEVFALAKEKKLLEKAGVDVEFTQYPSIRACVEAFSRGGFDGLCCTTIDQLLLVDRGFDLKAVMIMGYSNGIDALVARRGIGGIAQLRATRVGVSMRTVGEYLLYRALQRSFVSSEDVEIVDLSAEQIEQQLIKGQLSAGVVSEPALSRLLATGKVAVLFGSERLPGEIIDVLCLNKSVIEAKEEDCRRLVEGWFDALVYWSRQSADAEAFMASHEGTTRAALRRAISRLRLPRRNENARLIGTESQPGPFRASLSEVAKVLYDYAMLRQEHDASYLIDNRLLVRRAAP